MLIEKHQITQHNEALAEKQANKFNFFKSEHPSAESFMQKLVDFQIAIPSWALGTGGTRFGDSKLILI